MTWPRTGCFLPAGRTWLRIAEGSGPAVAASGTSNNARRVVLCNQPLVLDLGSGGARVAENDPPAVIHEVLARLPTGSSAGCTITAALRWSNPRSAFRYQAVSTLLRTLEAMIRQQPTGTEPDLASMVGWRTHLVFQLREGYTRCFDRSCRSAQGYRPCSRWGKGPS
jgi:hypothetical protein